MAANPDYLAFSTRRRITSAMQRGDEESRFRVMMAWTYFAIVRETMLATWPDRYSFPAGFRRENTDVAAFAKQLAGAYLYDYDVGFGGPDDLSGPLLEFLREETHAFATWAESATGHKGLELWRAPHPLMPTVAVWYDDLSPSAPRQRWFKVACAEARHARFFADMAAWQVDG
jgi:hypothetical protein